MTKSWAMRPVTISGQTYHDHKMVGIQWIEGDVHVHLQSPGKKKSLIILKNVKYFISKDVLFGNIVDYVSFHNICIKNIEEIADHFKEENSMYYGDNFVHELNSRSDILGGIFFSLYPSYGALIYAIAEDVQEHYNT